MANIALAVYHFLFVVPENWEENTYNLGGDCSMSILEVAEKISKAYKLKYKKNIAAIETKLDNNRSIISEPIRYSIEKIKRTGFALRSNMDFEIETTMELCKEIVK